MVVPAFMWTQTYAPLANSLPVSALVAALPVFTLLFLLGVARKPAWIAALAGLGTAAAVALLVYRMPAVMVASAAAYGAAYGLLPIGWIVFTAILLYRLTVETGKFEIIKDSIGTLTGDQRLQALLIAFAFGAFIEGAAGFGTPVAVAAAMLTGLGFSPFYAAGICLLANTSPVAFGSIGTPLIMLQTVTGLPMPALSSNVGRICAPVSLFVPAYLVLVMGGMKALRAVAPAAAVCGIAFAGAQFFVSNYLGPYLTDILGSLAAIGALVALLHVWRPEGAKPPVGRRHSTGEIMVAWAPYGLLVVLVLLWGLDSVKALLNRATLTFAWPGLHNLVLRVPPVTAKSSPYTAMYALNWLSASGTSCLFAVLAAAVVLRFSPRRLGREILVTAKSSPYTAMYALNWLSASGTSCLFAVLAAAVVLRFSPRRLGREILVT